MTADLGRRELLGLMGATGAALAASPTWARRDTAYTSEVGRKFYPDGRVHPFRGNTIICHVDQQGPNSAFFEAVLDFYRQFPALPFARKMSSLPPSSYHMTIFGGANDPDRRPGVWPRSLPLDTPIEECTRILGARLRKAGIGNVTPIRMRVDTCPPSPDETPLTIRLLPLDQAERLKLAKLRDRLSQVLEIRAESHDSYRYHVTVAYLITKMDTEERRAFREFYAALHTEIARRCPVIEFGQPEYCSLEDMFHFRRIFTI